MSETIIEQIEKFALSAKEKPKAEFSHVGIVGCGSTGQKIAVMIASKGIEVHFLEVSQEKIDEAYREIEEMLNETISHWGMTNSEKKLILSRIHGTLSYKDLSACDLVLEAILSQKEDRGIKIRKQIFKEIEKVTSKHAIIATNATTMVITELASELKHPERCVSMHFSTTAPGADIVEVVKGLHTEESVCDNIKRFCTLIGKNMIPVEESPGLISVRLGVAIISEACDLFMERVGTVEDIDYVMKRGLGLPKGPFEMADKIGLDRVERWMINLHREFGDPKYIPSPIIKRLVRAKRYGRKTCQGFYKYDEYGHKLKDQTKNIDC